MMAYNIALQLIRGNILDFLDGSKGHTSIVIELAGQEELEYQRAYEVDFSELDIPRDYVIDQIFCGENVTVYAVFEISEDGRKTEQQLDDPNFEDRGDYRIYREGSSTNALSREKFCELQRKVLSTNDIKLPSSVSDGGLLPIQGERNYEEEEKGFESKTLLPPEKISLGTNTSMAKFTPLFFEKKAVNFDEESKTSRKSEGQESQQKEKNKTAILKEIKKLQKKVNSLIRTIESNDFDLDAEDFEISVADSTSFEEAPKNADVGIVLNPPEKKHKKKYDDIPIFSPLTYSSSPRRTLPKQKKTKTARSSATPEIPKMLTRSISQLSVGSSPTQIIISSEKSETRLRKVSSECSINWQHLEDWRGAGLSKSEVINHAILLDPKYNIMKGVRKSLSLELRNDKLEVICLKKIKNFPFNLEGSVKSKGNVRILPKREPSLRESLPLLKREMGDEAIRKTKASKVDLLGFVQVCDKQNALSFEKINLTPNKSLNEDDGDAKLVYPKKNAASPRFARRNTELEVHFCSATNNTASDGLLKNEKNPSVKKLKQKPVESTPDPATKVCSDSEKPTTPVRKSRKTSVVASEGKKEAKPIKKSSKKNTKDKTDGKDPPPQEPVRTKPVANCSRQCARGHAESKIHVDKAIKPDFMNNHRTSHSGKLNFEEKPMCKVDRLPRLISQKKEVTEPPSDESKEKENRTLKKNSLMVNISHKKSVSDLTSEKPDIISSNEYVPNKSVEEEKSRESEQTPPVVVELFSEKPQPRNMVLSEVYNKCPKPKPNPEDVVSSTRENNKVEEINGEDSDEFKKPVVKSLWALTKLILFEDGTQKLEILEASLNPPEWV